MRIPVLVMTPTPAFGILIQQTLEDCGRYQVSLADSPRQALDMAGSAPYALCILDAYEDVSAQENLAEGVLSESGNAPGATTDASAQPSEITSTELGRALRQLLPAICLVVVPPNNDLASPLLEALRPEGTLTKPFYLPDLLDTLEEVMQGQGKGLLVPTASPGQGEAGDDRSEPPLWLIDVERAAQRLARLSMETAAQAALIIDQGALWAYAGELPQPAAQELAQIVARHWKRGGHSDLARFIRLETTQSEYMLYAACLGGSMALALVFGVETPFSQIRSQASALARSLASPPRSENNGFRPATNEALPPNQELTPAQDSFDPLPLFDDVPPPRATGWGSIPPYPDRSSIADADLPDEPFTDPLAETRPILVHLPSAESLSDGPEVLADETDALNELHSAAAARCNLNYACMLLPRLPQHHLTGELGTCLTKWVSQLCLAFGWRLEHLAVRPGYLLWIVNVSPTISPSYLVRLIRQHTSQRIFARFAGLADENPSGDFWAPGYLVMSSAQPPPTETIRDFIRETRRRQGALHSRTLQE